MKVSSGTAAFKVKDFTKQASFNIQDIFEIIWQMVLAHFY